MGHDEIRDFMQEKTTDELLAIWKANDRDQYSNAAFVAIESILRERGRTIEEQYHRPPPVRGKTCIGRFTYFLISLSVGLVHFRLVDSIPSDYMPLYLLLIVIALEFIVLIWAIRMRLNDLNVSGWYMLWLVVPVVNLLFPLVLLLFPGAPVEDEEDDDLQGAESKDTK